MTATQTRYLITRRPNQVVADGYVTPTSMSIVVAVAAWQSKFIEAIDTTKLRPMTLAQIAAEVGVDTSTVSRLVRGITLHITGSPLAWPLDTLFSGEGGRPDLSAAADRQIVWNLVDDESPADPYSDREIVDILAHRDIHLARRTVAKYRRVMGIPPVYQRRDRSAAA